MGEVIPIGAADSVRRGYRYAVYEHRLVTTDGLAYTRSFIVLKNRYGVIVRFTKLHCFTGAHNGKIYRQQASDVKQRLYYICMMLNYVLIDHYDIYGVDHVFKVTKDMLTAFFMDYAHEKKVNGKYRGPDSIERCVHAVALFFSKLIYKYGGYVALKRNELYIPKEIRTPRGIKTISVPDFQITGVPEQKDIFRDIPTKAFQILLNHAVRFAPDIAFAIALQAFAGLRPGEVCSVRQEGSPKGPGLLFIRADGRIVRAEIDLRHEYAMRSDGVICGKIKKERAQGVYPAFLPVFQRLYEMHKEYLAGREFEKDYCPMFVNARGMAMTYEDYSNRFRDLVDNHFRPALLRQDDQELRIYGQMLCEHTLGPHALRHWFSVQLVLRGEDIAQLQFWRGDLSPQSAFDYLMNKGDLIRELEEANEMLAWFLKHAVEEPHEG